MKPRHDEEILDTINAFWLKNHCSPQLREIAELANIPAHSGIHYRLPKIPGIRIDEHNRVIPKWVDDLFDNMKK